MPKRSAGKPPTPETAKVKPFNPSPDKPKSNHPWIAAGYRSREAYRDAQKPQAKPTKKAPTPAPAAKPKKNFNSEKVTDAEFSKMMTKKLPAPPAFGIVFGKPAKEKQAPAPSRDETKRPLARPDAKAFEEWEKKQPKVKSEAPVADKKLSSNIVMM